MFLVWGLGSSQIPNYIFRKPFNTKKQANLWRIPHFSTQSKKEQKHWLNSTTHVSFIRLLCWQGLAVAVQLQGVAPSPGSATRATNGVMEFVALAQTAALPPGWRQPTHLSVLVDGPGDPLRVGVAADGLVEGIDQDHLEKLVSGIFTHPIGVQDSQSPTVPASTLLEERNQRKTL